MNHCIFDSTFFSKSRDYSIIILSLKLLHNMADLYTQ